jgi:predicted amidohydrolase
MVRTVRIGLIQCASILADTKSNVKKGLRMAEDAANKGAKIVCLPETFTTGYNIDILKNKIQSLAECRDGYTVSLLKRLAKKKRIYIIAPLILTKKESPGLPTNSAVFIDDRGELMGVYTKNHLWPLETPYFTSGHGYPVFETRHASVGIMICYDANFPEPARILALKGAEIVFMPCAWRVQDKTLYDLIVPARAMDNQFFVAAVNMFGMQGDLELFGHSKVADGRGAVIAESRKDSEDVLIVDIDLDEVAQLRSRMPLLRDRRPEQYSLICRTEKNNE